MKAVELNLPKGFNESFTVFKEVGTSFPVPWHYHEHYELVLVLKSSGRRMVGDHIGHFEPDDLVFMGSMLPHVWVNDEEYMQGSADSEAEAIVIHFTSDFLGPNILNIPEMENLKKMLKVSQRGVAFRGKTRDQINAIVRRMPESSGLKRISLLFEIFDLLANTSSYELLASPSFMQNYHRETDHRFRDIMKYIIENHNQRITLKDVAEVANMSNTAFCNYFKERFRMTFVEYLNSIRIGQACVLMSESDHNIAQIAYRCGFNNLANFNRQFKKHKDITPSKYREQIALPQST